LRDGGREWKVKGEGGESASEGGGGASEARGRPAHLGVGDDAAQQAGRHRLQAQALQVLLLHQRQVLPRK
jgi:hypothetical protein